jgi:Zn-dependent metalloprotease
MQNLTDRQTELLKELQTIEPELQFEWDDVRGVASYMRGNLSEAIKTQDNPESTLSTFLEKYGELFGPPDILSALDLLQRQDDDLGWTHLEYQQIYYSPGNEKQHGEKIEVYGSKLVAHFNADGTLIEVQSSCWREIQVSNDQRITPGQLKEMLTQAVEQAPGYEKLQEEMRELQEENFPIMQSPRLVVYPWKERFYLAWATYAYGLFDEEDFTGKPTGRQNIDLGQVFADATTGEVILFAPTSMGIETPDTGTGLGVTPIAGPTLVTRNLNIVRVDTSSTYRLRDTTHTREIIIYDAANSDSYNTDNLRGNALNGGTLPVSADTDGDRNWNILPTDTSVAQRTASQQPEVDLHYHVRDAYEWNNALAGRAGWDDGQYPSPPVPNQIVRAIAHVKNGNDPSAINAGMRRGSYGGNWLYWLQFFDGNRTTYDYLAGSKFLVGHEYQHAITEFSFRDGAGNPGLTYSDWLAAIHEGLSDVFGCLYSEEWRPGTDISPSGQIFRNIAFPRDTTPYDPSKFDHFADRNNLTGDNARYFRGDILAHCAYLMGAGGVHQRAARMPSLIPVYSLGRQTVNGRDVLKTARIWYRALRSYFGTVGTATGVPTNDENTFRNIRNACISAAQDIYMAGSREHRTTVLAFYAVGLQPTGTPYGPDVTFLRWGWDWRFSRPYIGVSSPDWSSRDLYVKNGSGAAGWNALINILDAMGNPTQFENDVYCRVRNIGDQDANNVMVTFEYARIGTGIVLWRPLQDRNGVNQTLNLGTLAAGQSNFPDSAQDTPPTTARIKWHIPPLAAGETVNHFCLRATVTSSNDVNPYNNEVQSNIAYTSYTPGMGLTMDFVAGNPTEKAIPLELVVQTTLPKGWDVSLPDSQQAERLEPKDERVLQAVINMATGAEQGLEPPFDGDIEGEMYGYVSGPFSGTLSETKWDGESLKGLFAANVEYIGFVAGEFQGWLNPSTGEIKGAVRGSFQYEQKEGDEQAPIAVRGCLRPWRQLNISQLVDGQPIGGITIQVQVPLPPGPCAQELPPTDTNVPA